MILTAQEEYGIRCALSLARAQARGEEALTLTQVAEAEGLTPPYAGKLLRILVQADLVESTRGRSGGYRLQRPAREISVAQTLEALGSKIYDGEICKRPPGEVGLCVHNNDCSVRSLWTGLQTMIDRYLGETSLHDLITDEQSMSESLAEVPHGR